MTPNYPQCIELPLPFRHIAPMRPTKIPSVAAATALLTIGLSLLFAPPSSPAQTPEALKAFEQYVRAAEAQVQSAQDLSATKNFLTIDALPEAMRTQIYAQLKQGQTVIERARALPTCPAPPGALIHDWTSTVFVPNVSLAQTLAALQDYDRDADYYRPQVVNSKLLAKSDHHYQVFLRLKQKHIITVVLDTEYEIQYTPVDPTHATSQSHSTRIAEVENADSSEEHIHIPGDDHGFLWRLNSYWRFHEVDGGVYIQCNAISLTRNVPPGLNWIIAPFVENIPRDSLRFTLTATREALLKKFTSPQTTGAGKSPKSNSE